MFQDTRYAMNGDLRVAYRASREGPRDIVVVPPWLSNCEVFPELPGRNAVHFVEPWRQSFQEVAQFLTGQQTEVADDRVLATVLFTDIVDSTRRAAEIGDRDWYALLDAHDAVVRAQLNRFRGREVNTSGDGFLAMFDAPQRAIRCAMAIRDAVQALGIEVRAGLHTGECEVRGDDIGGIAGHSAPGRAPGRSPCRRTFFRRADVKVRSVLQFCGPKRLLARENQPSRRSAVSA